MNRKRKTNLSSSDNQRIPIYPRQHILQELWVRRDTIGYQFAVFGVQREGGGCRFAGFHRAGEEVEG